MRGIDEKTLIAVRKSLAAEGLNTDAVDALISLKVRELQEPWMALDEFLKSGFEGLCWVYLSNKYSGICEYSEGVFKFRYGVILKDNITHVMSLHKPEPPGTPYTPEKWKELNKCSQK